MLHTILALICILLLAAYGWRLRRDPGRIRTAALLPAAGATICLLCLEALFAALPNHSRFLMRPLLFCQYLLGPSWLAYSLAYGREFFWKGLNGLGRLMLLLALLPLPFLLFLPVETFFYQTDFALEPLIFLEPAAFFFYLHLVLVLLLALGNLESTLRDSHHGDLWRIKLALMGLGALIASLAIFYSQGILFKALNMRYLPLRDLGMILGLMLLHFAEWRRDSGKVALSRRVAFRSLAVTVAGLYLLGLAVMREGTRVFGEDFSIRLFTAFVFLFFCFCLLLLLSQTLRRKAGIWLQQRLYNEKYDYRGQWLQFSERLSEAGDKESLVRASLLCFCETFGCVGAFFLPLEKEASSRLGRGIFYEMDRPGTEETLAAGLAPRLDLPGVPISFSALKRQLPPDAAAQLQAGGASFILPIRSADGPEGIMVLGQPIDRKEAYDSEDFELMEAMGRQVGLCARSFRLGDELVAAREMETLGRLGAFVLHDLKNQVYALSLLTENARRFITDPEFQKDLLETLGNTVANMNILSTQLTRLPCSEALRLEKVDLHQLARQARARLPQADIRVSGPHLTLVADAEQLIKVLVNLCLNAHEAGPDKPIHIEIAGEKSAPVLRVRDRCGGIAEEVLRRGLFKPFNSTKRHGMGIGLYHARTIVEAHGGKMQLENRPGDGSDFILRFTPDPAETPVKASPGERREERAASSSPKTGDGGLEVAGGMRPETAGSLRPKAADAAREAL